LAAQTVNPGFVIGFNLLSMPLANASQGVPPVIDTLEVIEVKGRVVTEITQSLAVLDTNAFNWGLYIHETAAGLRDPNDPNVASMNDWLQIDGGLMSGTLTTPVGTNQFTYNVPSISLNWKGRKLLRPGFSLQFVVASSSVNLDSLVCTPYLRASFDRVA
jgi:hypothetical protein